MTRTGKWKFTTVGLTLCVVTKCHLKVKSDCSSCSVAKSCLTLCDPMNCSTSGFPVLHYLPKFALLTCPTFLPVPPYLSPSSVGEPNSWLRVCFWENEV